MNRDTILLLNALIAVVGLVVLIARFKLNAFVSLLLASLWVGVSSGTGFPPVAKAITDGVGGVLGSIAIIVGLGTIVGKLLAESGGAEVVAEAFLRRFGERQIHWAMMFVGFVVGIAVWFTVGLVLLIPVAYTLARKSGVSLLVPGIPMVAGLSVMHGLVPPHPGPMVAIGLLHADTGKTILYSMIVGLPAAAIAGPVFVRLVGRRIIIGPGGLAAQLNVRPAASSPPGLALTVFTIVLPVVLMLGATVADVGGDLAHRWQQWASDGGHAWFFTLSGGLDRLRPWTAFAGTPTVAMLIAVLFALYAFGAARGFDRHQLAKFCEECLAPVATVLLVVGAGGGFSKVLDVCGVGQAIAANFEKLELSPLLLGWLLAALIRIAVGSATVAISTAAGILAPMASGTNPELLVIAMGAGSVILSHVNDGGFWFVKEYFGMSVPQTLKTWTVMESIIAITTLVFVLILDVMVA
jgi:GntP family gluconate:H+ symporter